MRPAALSIAVACLAAAGPAAAANWIVLRWPASSNINYRTLMAVDQSTIERSGSTVRFQALVKSEWNNDQFSYLYGETDCNYPNGSVGQTLSRITLRQKSVYELSEVERWTQTPEQTSSLSSSEGLVATQLCSLRDSDIVGRVETDFLAVVAAKLQIVRSDLWN